MRPKSRPAFSISRLSPRGSVLTGFLWVVGVFATVYGLACLEVMRRAQDAYSRGEAAFAQKDYKHAMWDYQEVEEFYYLPRTHWVDLAEEKEWMCRAYLGDWVPPEGPLDADVRKLRPDYPKYQQEIAQITPVGDASYNPAPLTPDELKAEKKKKP